jgi:hypothetical protein
MSMSSRPRPTSIAISQYEIADTNASSLKIALSIVATARRPSFLSPIK